MRSLPCSTHITADLSKGVPAMWSEALPAPRLLARNLPYPRLRGPQIVCRRKQDLGPPHACRDGNQVPQLNRLVGKDGIVFLRSQYGHASANVSGERLHFFE